MTLFVVLLIIVFTVPWVGEMSNIRDDLGKALFTKLVVCSAPWVGSVEGKANVMQYTGCIVNVMQYTGCIVKVIL